jgi:hypothetical protein
MTSNACWLVKREHPASDRAVENTSDVVHYRQVREEGTHVGELGVVWVVEPRRDGHGVVRVEDVGRGRVVDDDAGLHLAAELGEVLCPRRKSASAIACLGEK